MRSGIKCSAPSAKDLEKIKSKGWHVYTYRDASKKEVKYALSDASITAVMTLLQSDKKNPVDFQDIDKAIKEHSPQIMQALSDAAENELKQQSLQEDIMIGNAKVVIGANYQKGDTTKHPDTLYVFTDNLQAYLYFASDEVKQKYSNMVQPISEKDVKLLSVKTSSAIVRTTDMESHTQSPNAIGFVVKKAAYEKGDFTNRDSDQFQDMDSEVFREINTAIARKIKAEIEAKGYKRVLIPSSLSGEKSRLTRKNAEILQQILRDELGIESIIKSASIDSEGWYKLELIKKASKKRVVNEKTKRLQEEAKKSLQAETPSYNANLFEANRQKLMQSSRNILTAVFPDTLQRESRVNYVFDEFRDELTRFIEDKVADLQKLAEEHPEMMAEQASDKYTLNDVLDHLTKGTDSEIRVFALKEFKVDNGNTEIPLAVHIINSVFQNFQTTAAAAFENPTDEEPKQSWIDGFAKQVLLNPNTDLGETFAIETEERRWSPSTAEKQAQMRARKLAVEYRKMSRPDVFMALIKASMFDFELMENLHIDSITGNTANSQSEEHDTEGQTEETTDLGKEGYMVKYKLINPRDTMSVRMKNLLGKLYKMHADKNGNIVHSFDDLGRPIRVSAGEAYYAIVEAFSNDVTTEEDMDSALLKLADNKPWLNGILPILIKEEGEVAGLYDFNIRKEFYSTFFVTKVVYAKMQGAYLMTLNKDAEVGTFLKHTENNINGHIVLGPLSIYNEDGQINIGNVKRIHDMFDMGKNLHTVLNTFRDIKRGIAKVAEIDKAIKILRKGDLFKNLLHNIGISTDNIDVDMLLPDIDISEFLKPNGRYDLGRYLDAIGGNNIEALENILNQIQIITNISSENEKNVLQEGDLPTVKFRASYVSIGNSLKEPSDGYTMTMFRGPDGNDRCSYVAPDMISIIIRSIKSNDPEKARKFIIERWGNIDYFRDQTYTDPQYGWRNSFLADFMLQDSSTENWRKDFDTIQLLSLLDSQGRDTQVKDVTDVEYQMNAFAAFRGVSTTISGATMGYFTNPLFSDTDACVLFKARKFVGPNYKEDIISRMVKVFDQEYERILDVRKARKKGNQQTVIENFNDGKAYGEKFCLLPEFNLGVKDIEGNTIIPSIEEIDAELDAIRSDNADDVTAYSAARTAYITSILEDLIEYNFDKYITKLNLNHKLVYALKDTMDKQDEYEKKKNRQGEEEQSASDEDSEQTDIKVDEEAEKLKYERTRSIVIGALREFFYNDFYVQSQLLQLLAGDLAYYKGFRDFIKRNKQSYACGPRLYAMDEEGHRITERCMYAEDHIAISNEWCSIRKLLSTAPGMSRMERDLLLGSVDAFKKINGTDGQSLRTLKSFKKIIEGLGKWDENMEQAFQNIRNGRLTAKEFQTIWTQLKPFLFAYEKRTIAGRTELVPIQHKNSEYLINAAFTALNLAMNKSPELVAIHRYMEDHDIDVMHFHSVVKVGYDATSAIDINHDDKRFKEEHPKETYSSYIKGLKEQLDKGTISQKEYNEAVSKYRYRTADEAYKAIEEQLGTKDAKGNLVVDNGKVVEDPNKIHTIDMKYFMFAQPTADHFTDADGLIGSQLQNVIPADLPESFTMTINIGGNDVTLNREESVLYYNRLLVEKMLRAYRRVVNEFATIKDLKAALDARMSSNPKYGPDIKEALELSEDGKSFKLPFISPNLTNKIEELMLSVFKNAIQKKTISGGNITLLSSYGLSDDLHIQYKDTRDGKLLSSDEVEKIPQEFLGIAWVPCLMPIHDSQMISDFLEKTKDGYYTINFDKMAKELGKSKADKLLEAIGYRIPTEDKYSVLPLRVVGFIPEFAGASIVLPTDIVTMSGMDFDIDKLFLMMREYRRETYSSDMLSDFLQTLHKSDIAILDLLKNALNMQEEAISENPDISKNSTLKEALETIYTTKDNSAITHFIKKHKIGLTDEEVADLMQQNDDFRDYVENGNGASFRYKIPKYRIIEPTLQYDAEGNVDIAATVSGASNAAINNMYIDSSWGILTSNAGSKLSMLPGGYDNIKYTSRVQRIIQDKDALIQFVKIYADTIKAKGSAYAALCSLDLDTLDAFYEKYTMQSPLSISDRATNFRNLMDGGDLIGIFAVNSSCHYKYQFLDLTLDESFQFQVLNPDGKKVPIYRLDPKVSPINGVNVGRICAEAQAASPDNGKDPCLGDLGINPKTSGFVGFLARIGMSWSCIGTINNASEIAKIGSELKDELQSKRVSIRTTPLKSFVIDENMIGDLLIKYRLSQNIKDFTDNLNAVETQYLVDFGSWYGAMHVTEGPVWLTQLSTSVSRSDSPNGALPVNIAEAMQQKIKAEMFVRAASRTRAAIQGFKPLVDIYLNPIEYDWTKGVPNALREKLMESPIARLQASYTLGLMGGHELSKRYLPQLQDATYHAVEFLIAQTKQPYTFKKDSPKLRNFMASMLAYYVSLSDLFTGQDEGLSRGQSFMKRRNFYIHDFPIQFRAKLWEKDENGQYVYQRVRNLNIISSLGNRSEVGIKFQHIGSVSKKARQQFQDELLSMLYMGEKEARLAFDLFMYAYYDNGLAFRHDSFGLFFVTAFMEVMPRYVEGLWNAQNMIQNGDRRMMDSKGLQKVTYMQNFVFQYLLNNRSEIPIITNKDFKATESKKDGDKNTTTKFVILENSKSRYTSEGLFGGFVGLLRSYGRIYMLTDPNKGEYTQIDYPITTYGNTYYDANTVYYEIPYSELKGRGIIAKVEQDKPRDKKETIKEGEKSMKDTAREVDDPSNKEIPNDPAEAAETAAMRGVEAMDDAERKQAEREERIAKSAYTFNTTVSDEFEPYPVVSEDNSDMQKFVPDEQTKDEMCPPHEG